MLGKSGHGLGEREEDILLLPPHPFWPATAHHHTFFNGPCLHSSQVFGALQNSHPAYRSKSKSVR